MEKNKRSMNLSNEILQVCFDIHEKRKTLLSGSAKEQFEKWLQKEIQEDRVLWELCNLYGFIDLPESMQFGVYQDWADSLGYELCIDRCVDDECNYIDNFEWVVMTINTISNNGSGGTFPTRQEARNAAIEKLNDLLQ